MAEARPTKMSRTGNRSTLHSPLSALRSPLLPSSTARNYATRVSSVALPSCQKSPGPHFNATIQRRVAGTPDMRYDARLQSLRNIHIMNHLFTSGIRHTEVHQWAALGVTRAYDLPAIVGLHISLASRLQAIHWLHFLSAPITTHCPPDPQIALIMW